MSDTFFRIVELVGNKDYRISNHAFDELLADNLTQADVIDSIPDATLIEEYPDFPKGPSVLLLRHCVNGRPLHAVRGIPKNHLAPAVLITAYLPDPNRWTEDFKRRINDDEHA